MDEEIKLADFGNLLSLDSQYSKEFIAHNGLIVLSENEDIVTVAISEDVSDDMKDSILMFHHPKHVSFVPVTKAQLISYLGGNSTAALLDVSDEADRDMYFSLESIQSDAPVVNIINAVIIDAVRNNASDIHIDLCSDKLRIRYRIDGMMMTVKTLPSSVFPNLSSRIKIMSQLNIMEQRHPQDGRMTVSLGKQNLDIRVSIIPAMLGESIVMRVFNLEGKHRNLYELGFSEKCIADLLNIIRQPVGLVLVTGPTGSGKSSTLHALIEQLPSDELKIITLEDPVEQIMDGVTQISINEKLGVTFDSLLPNVLRHDPNVVMIGEIRDSETAELAVRAANAGRLILATLHTNDGASAIARMIDLGVAPYMLADVLKCVIAQRLVRKPCVECVDMRNLTLSEEKLFGAHSISAKTIPQVRGCVKCHNSGYSGRTVVGEYYVNSAKLTELIESKASTEQIRAYLAESNMVSMEKDGLEKVKECITTIEEIKREVPTFNASL